MKPPRLWAGVNGSGGFLAPRGGRGFRMARSADGLSKGRVAETDSYKELLKSFREMGLRRNSSRASTFCTSCASYPRDTALVQARSGCAIAQVSETFSSFGSSGRRARKYPAHALINRDVKSSA